jgi:hypothetical protein
VVEVFIVQITKGRVGSTNKPKQRNDMTSAIITSARYIALVDKSGSVAFQGTVRILSKDGLVTPAKWNPAHKRLESVALNRPAAAEVALPMYEKSERIERALAKAGIAFLWLTAEQAQELTA